MKTISKVLFLFVVFVSSSYAYDLEQIRARNEAAEQGLLDLRVERAKAILAGTDGKVSWRNKVVELNQQVASINIYTVNQQAANRALAIDASQQLIKELAMRYSKRVYGSTKKPDNWQQDEFLVNFVTTFRILKAMEKHPDKHAVLYPMLQQNLQEMDSLIAAR